MSKQTLTRATEPGAAARYRPMYARALRLRHLHPGGMLCFAYLEGAVALSLLLALAELVSWWVVLVLPVSIALMVKVNDLVAGTVARSAARTPERERERLRREVIAFMPTVGHATISPRRSEVAAAALTEATVQLPTSARQDVRARQDLSGRQDISAGRELSARQDIPGGCDLSGRQDIPAGQEFSGEQDIHAGRDTGRKTGWETQAGRDMPAGRDLPAGRETGRDKPAGQDTPAAQDEVTAQFAVIAWPEQDVDAAALGRRDAAGRYAAAGRHLDAAWRQHAYTMAHHAEHADPASPRERQSASRRYE